MKIFSPIYKRMLKWASHPRATLWLFILSFAESSFFPIPPDVMLAPMVLAKPAKAWSIAGICTLGGVLGAYVGYAIGLFCFIAIKPWLIKLGYYSKYELIETWFVLWGFWVMFFAGFAFMPYKLFTIAAGATGLGLVPFTLGSIVGRGGRFFLVAAVIRFGGIRMERALLKYIDYLGWSCTVLVIGGLTLWRYAYA